MTEKIPLNKEMLKIIYLWLLLFLLSIAILVVLYFFYHALQRERQSYRNIIEVFRVIDLVERQVNTTTLEIRSFIISGQPSLIASYWRHLDEGKPMDEALKSLRALNLPPESFAPLLKAKSLIDETQVSEVHAIKLLAEAYQASPVLLSNDVKSYLLTPEENMLSAEEKQKQAHDLLFSLAYTNQKIQIIQALERLQHSLNEMIDNYGLREVKSTNRFILSLVILLVVQMIAIMSIIWLRAFGSMKRK